MVELQMPDEDRARIVERAQRRIDDWNWANGSGRGGVPPFLAHKHAEIILLRDLVVAIQLLERDKARLDWLESQHVEVWTLLAAGAQRNFMSTRAEPNAPSDLRAQIDARLLLVQDADETRSDG